MKKSLILFAIIPLLLLFSCTKDTSDEPKVEKPVNTYIDGKEYVDLGLSVKWAACNLGANSPEEPGNYFILGRPAEGVIATTFTPGQSSLPDSEWGNKWRMPTKSEIEELVSECIYEVVFVNGKKVGKITADNGNYIILPFNPKSNDPTPNAFYPTSNLRDMGYEYDLDDLHISDQGIGFASTEIRDLSFDYESDYSSTYLIRAVSNY